MAPISSKMGYSSSDADTFSLLSQATTMTIGDNLLRKDAKKGFTFNIMLVGPRSLGKTTLLSAIFGKKLDIHKEKPTTIDIKDIKDEMEPVLNPQIDIETKSFEIDEKNVRLKLTVTNSYNYGLALCLQDTHFPLVDYIDQQFADYHKRELGFDRRNIKDKMVHCLLFFINSNGFGLDEFDIEFLKSVNGKVNIIPIIARAEGLTPSEKASFKRRLKEDLEKNEIRVYQLPDPDPDESDDMKRCIKEIQDTMPFAISSMTLTSEGSVTETQLDWATRDPYNRDQSDFLLLKLMLHRQMKDLRDDTHEIFYEQYRIKKMNEKISGDKIIS